MAKIWISGCKVCGKEIFYSDRSYVYSQQFGFSRPEYCEEHQKLQTEQRGQLGVSYFGVTVDSTKEIETTLGGLEHPGRNHHLEESEGKFDPSQFGLTPNKIKEIADWFDNPKHRVAIVVGPTGSGKSTALPYWMIYPPKETGLEPDHFTRNGQILHTQPRILAATGQASFVGEVLIGGTIGAGTDVGFKYSQHDQSDWRNAWVTETDGLFINEIIQGKIGRYGYIIIDEAHERSLNIDQILRLLKEYLPLYPKLKLIIASATINAEDFRNFFGDDVATIIEFEGKQRLDKDGNPVSYQVFYQDETDDTKKIFPYNDLKKLGKIIVESAVDKTMWLVKQIISGEKSNGDVLVFLQGVDPIDSAVTLFNARLESDAINELVEVYPLYRDLPEDEKEKIKKHDTKDGKIWVIFSTNIAEASVTIDSLGYEIETGVENQAIFDSNTETTSVPLTLISKANCTQRWGRTGRTRNGEVYCLYTREQYDTLFPRYPMAAINRSSMESMLLTLKTAGITDLNTGWLENPRSEEIDRSKESLINVGALLESGNLSKKGLMLRSFSYSANIVEALLQADELGCLIEMISIIPVLKNGGNRRIFNWNFGWDQYTKQNAYMHHRALMAGCRDDIDFIIKIMKRWTEMSLVDRKIWAETNFVKIETMEEIDKERSDLLKQFYDDAKDREIDLMLISRVRTIITSLFPESIDESLIDEYQYDFSIKPKDQSSINCRCLKTVGLKEGWMQPQVYSQESDEISFENRITIDQLYPINTVLKKSELQKYKGIDLLIPENSDETDLRIVGYSFGENQMVLIERVEQTEPFDLFVTKYKQGDSISIKVLEVRSYPNDKSPILVAEEIITKCPILIAIQDISFSNSSSVFRSVPINSIMEVAVENIDIDKRQIYVSTWMVTEKRLTKIFNPRSREESQSVVVKVVNIETGNVQFATEWIDIATGFFPTIIVYSEKLGRPSDSFSIGEELLFLVNRNKKSTKVPLTEISEKLTIEFQDGKKTPGLTYRNKLLSYDGPMSTETKRYLKTLDEDQEFLKAVDKIYWLSNRLYFERELDVTWWKEVTEKFNDQNKIVTAIIETIDPNSGLILKVDGYKAFMPRSLAINGSMFGWDKILFEGDKISAKIETINPALKQLILRQVAQ